MITCLISHSTKIECAVVEKKQISTAALAIYSTSRSAAVKRLAWHILVARFEVNKIESL